MNTVSFLTEYRGEWSSWSSCSKTCQDSEASRPFKSRQRCELYGNKTCITEKRICTDIDPCPIGMYKNLLMK